MDPQTLHGEKLGSVTGLQSQWWGSGRRRIPGACCLARGPVGELQDDEERDPVSREQPKKTPEVNLRVSHVHMHKKQVSKEEWGHFSVGGLGSETIPACLWERPWVGQEVSTDWKAPRHGLSAFGVAGPHTMPQLQVARWVFPAMVLSDCRGLIRAIPWGKWRHSCALSSSLPIM